MNFSFADEFAKDLKYLKKKWRSISDDIEYVKPRIESLYQERSDIDIAQYRADFFAGKNASVLHSSLGIEVVKMRLDCASLRGNDKIRLVFIAICSKNEVKFIELYSKSDKQREDIGRINKYLD